jgi:hypothetical protein
VLVGFILIVWVYMVRVCWSFDHRQPLGDCQLLGGKNADVYEQRDDAKWG